MNDNQLQINLYPLSGKCSEADAAKLLSEMISKTIPSASKGTIYILSGVNIPFGRVSDIDILLVADLHDCHLIIDDNEIDVRSFVRQSNLKNRRLMMYMLPRQIFMLTIQVRMNVKMLQSKIEIRNTQS